MLITGRSSMLSSIACSAFDEPDRDERALRDDDHGRHEDVVIGALVRRGKARWRLRGDGHDRGQAKAGAGRQTSSEAGDRVPRWFIPNG
jgi:hypothetical protein